eukprot:4527211-Heterocapsa_arctica.AAC.1
MDKDSSRTRQSLAGSPFGPWEEFRRRPGNYAAWAAIQLEKWAPPKSSATAEPSHGILPVWQPAGPGQAEAFPAANTMNANCGGDDGEDS